jgi:gliding motility-associated-like protein
LRNSSIRWEISFDCVFLTVMPVLCLMLRSFLYIFFLLFSVLAAAQDFSNKGREFWVGYGYHQAMSNTNSDPNSQKMVLYFTSDVAATVNVEIPGLGWARTYQVAANTVVESDEIPKAANQDARLLTEGLHNTGIHITSSNPIVAYAHIYSLINSSASLLFPVNTLGQDYYSLNFAQKTNLPESNSWAFVIATEDNTLVEITPSAKTITHPARAAFTIPLNKGQIYNLMGETNGNDGVDLTGTRIRSISSGTAACKPIAVYSGSGRSSIACDYTNFPSSDNLFQQVFPRSAWGRKFLTVPTSELPANYFRVAVSDPSTIVSVDGVRATNLINGFYYEFTANTPKNIVSDKPVMVAQYITSSDECGNAVENGDPEMIYLSPVEQTIDKVTLNSTRNSEITTHYINVTIKTAQINSFTLDGQSAAAQFKPHPADPTYAYAVFNVKQGTHTLKADSGFNAIAYGYGIKESYGYNAGTNIKNLDEFVTVQNTYAFGNTTCRNNPFSLAVTVPYKASTLTWDFGNNPNLSPSQTVIQNNPAVDSSYTLEGKTFYVYKFKTSLTFKTTGIFPVKIFANNQSSDGCNGVHEIDYDIPVVDPPVAAFTINHKGCVTDTATFVNSSSGAGHPIVGYKWDFGDGTQETATNPSKLYKTAGQYNVKLTAINDIGCFSDTLKAFNLALPPLAKFGFSTQNCVDSFVTLTDSSNGNGGKISAWIWNLGNGQTLTNSTNAPVKAVYAAAGDYSVSLQVQNETGCKSAVVSNSITVHSTPVVDFSAAAACLPSQATQFSNLSTINDGTANSLTYSWNFGDGGLSNEKDPPHLYKTSDSFKVNLRATSSSGCANDTTKIVSNVYARPQAAFTVNSAATCVTDSVRFTDASIAEKSAVNTWFWVFGDGTTSAIQNPVKKYSAPGSYPVTLYVKSAVGCVSDTFNQTIVVNKSPTAAFSIDPSACEKQPVTITNLSTSENGLITKWFWDFGDGTSINNQNGNAFTKSYDKAGRYAVRLKVEANNGCKSDTTTQLVDVLPPPVTNFITSVTCLNDPFTTFTDSSYVPGANSALTYAWNFGDQASSPENPNTSTQKNPTHRYSLPGAYNVSLTTTSAAGCSSSLTKPFVVNGNPNTDFIVLDSAALCGNSEVRIQNNSTVSPGAISKIEINWDADDINAVVETDNAPAGGKIYSHTYLAGNKTYRIRMIAYSGKNCFTEKVIPINVKTSPKVSFSPVPPLCLSDNVYTIKEATETTGVAGTFAFFGNAVSPQGVFDPRQAGAGSTEVKYVFTSAAGCKDSSLQVIRVLENPVVTLPQRVFVLTGTSVLLEPTITGNVSTYNWSPPTGLDNPSVQTPRTTPLQDITYRLTVSSPEGCQAFDDVLVSILSAPNIPNAFSPNGDGVNDLWNIAALQSLSNCTVQVFNRFGKIVFTSTGYKTPWDGRSNGSVLPVGVYYYVITTTAGKKPYTGSVTILK